ncbi:hypothetical protein P3S67_012252 [Capsicum chacoense]
MISGGFTFFAGALSNGASQNISMLILGRILLGFGVGFANQAILIYLSEMAPSKWCGAFSTGFQFFVGLRFVTANCISYGISMLSWGRCLSLRLAVAPAATMTIGAILIFISNDAVVRINLRTYHLYPQSKLKGFKYIAFESLLRLRRDLNHDLPEFLFHSCDTPFGTGALSYPNT